MGSLHELIALHRSEILDACVRTVPGGASGTNDGIPRFVDQIVEALTGIGRPRQVRRSAVDYARQLRASQCTVAHVVREYGNVCDAITRFAMETGTVITPAEFRTLNCVVGDAVAGAVTEYGRLHETDTTARLEKLSMELRDVLHRALLAFDMMGADRLGPRGATADLLGRSLASLRALVDREIVDARVRAGRQRSTKFGVRELIEDVEADAAIDARTRRASLSVSTSLDPDVMLQGDRETVESVVGGLLDNAFECTPVGGTVSLHAHASDRTVWIEVHDQCGGLTPRLTGRVLGELGEHALDPGDSWVGRGLTLCRDGARANGGTIKIRNRPGRGCVFTLELPRPAI